MEPEVEEASFGAALNVAVIGASGGIGRALGDQLAACRVVSNIAASELKCMADAWHLVIVATGILHDENRLQPEKTWRALSAPAMETAFRINAIGPTLVAKHVLPLLATNRKSVFAALSARVGSIGDNQLSGWHAYRSSKAALNMLLKTLSIELERRNPQALCVGLLRERSTRRCPNPFKQAFRRGGCFRRSTPLDNS